MYLTSVLCILFVLFQFSDCKVTPKPKPTNPPSVSNDIHSISLKNYTSINSEVSTEYLTIESSSTISILITDIPIKTKFLVVQVHSYLYDVSIQYPDETEKVTGTNTGFVYMVTPLRLPVFYVSNIHSVNISTMIAIIGYGIDYPVPGGCNMEFSTNMAPYLKVNSSYALITVLSQPALLKKCNEPFHVIYNYYHLYQKEADFTAASYFKDISTMISPNDIVSNGKLVPFSPLMTPMKRLFSAYHGTGSVYVLLATVYGTNISAAYIPGHTYACDMLSNVHPCVSSPLEWSILAVIFSLVGVFLCLYGHWYFKSAIFLFGLAVSMFLTYIFTEQDTLSEMPVSQLLLLLPIGLIGGLLWLFVWKKMQNPFTSTSVASIVLSTLIFAILMYSPFGDNTMFQLEFNYIFVFICLLSIILILLTMFPQTLHMLSCALCGGYLIIFALDYFLATNLKFIIINLVRRITVDNFNLAIIDPPYQNIDLLLTIIWAILVFIGLISQKMILRGEAEFPYDDNEDLQRRPLLSHTNDRSVYA